MRVFNKMFVILVYLTFGFAKAQYSSHQTALPLLLLSTDARSGGANNGVATSSDAYSVFHNPFKVVFGESNQLVSFSFSPWLRGIAKDVFLGELSYVNKNREESGLGALFKYFSLGKVDFRTLEGRDIGVANPTKSLLTGMYMLKLYDSFSRAMQPSVKKIVTKQHKL